MFGLATGWLGWIPSVAWHTPIPELLLAYEAKIKFLQATNPFGSGEKKSKEAIAKDARIGFRAAAMGRKAAMEAGG
jgi:hypothetical protein